MDPSPCLLSKILSALEDKLRIAFEQSRPKEVGIIFRSRFYLSPKITLTSYYTLIHPHIEFSISKLSGLRELLPTQTTEQILLPYSINWEF